MKSTMNPERSIDYGNKDFIKDIWSFIAPYKTKFYWGTFFRATSDIIWLFPTWALSEIITFASNYQPGESTRYVWQLLAAMLAVAVYHFVSHEIAKYQIYQVAERTCIDAYKQAIRHLFAIDMQWHEQENSGNKMQRISKGGASLDNMIRFFVTLIIESSINVIAIIVILSFLNPYFAFILIFFFTTYYLLSLLLTKKAAHHSYLANLEWEEFSGKTFESVNNISLVKSLRIGAKLLPYLEKIGEQLFEKIKVRIYYFRKREGILNLYQELFRIIMVSFTLWQILQGNLEVGVLAMVLLYFGKIAESASEFAQTYSEFVISKIAMFRMKEILRTEPTVENSGTKRFDPDWKIFAFRDVSFSYHGKPVLKDFSLEIKRGEKIGIVGISGTGKSTLLKLILKLYDNYTGEICFDGTSLHDVKRASYMEHVAVVPQETELFNLSLEENITLCQSGKNPKQFQKALDIAHVQDFTPKLPEGIKSLVGEKGVKLSGGEKQRVGIARAIYLEPEILLLDEATSHLDIESEKKIQDALHLFFHDITAIVIAHRLSTIKEMDRIVVMEKGKVLEIGAFAELMEQKGAFYRLWEQQKF